MRMRQGSCYLRKQGSTLLVDPNWGSRSYLADVDLEMLGDVPSQTLMCTQLPQSHENISVTWSPAGGRSTKKDTARKTIETAMTHPSHAFLLSCVEGLPSRIFLSRGRFATFLDFDLHNL